MMHCWKCHKIISEEKIKLGFRAQCKHCETDLHVCVNCRHYAPGKPNDCNVPGTDYVRDREAMNYCEEFDPRIPSFQKPSTDKFKSLFKDEQNI